MLDTVMEFCESKDWYTWVSHIVMAGAIGALAGSLFAGMITYLWREVEQVNTERRLFGWATVRLHAVDHILDFAVPFVALGLLTLV